MEIPQKQGNRNINKYGCNLRRKWNFFYRISLEIRKRNFRGNPSHYHKGIRGKGSKSVPISFGLGYIAIFEQKKGLLVNSRINLLVY